MNIYLTIPEFIVALFGLDPSQCRLTNSGRIANLHGFAYQVQSLLFEQVKIKHVSYRTETAKLGKGSYQSWHGKVSSTTARFELNTLIEALAQITIKQPNQLAAAFGKDRAWSWRWPLWVFILGGIIFNALVAYNTPLSNGMTYWQVMKTLPAIVAMVFFSLLFLFLCAIPLRQFWFDSSFLRRQFQTSLNMAVIRAEIFKRIKDLSKEAPPRGLLPDLIKLIDEASKETFDYTVEQLLNKLQNTELTLQTTTTQNQQLLKNQSEAKDLIASLRFENNNLQKEVQDNQNKLRSEERNHDKTKAELTQAKANIEELHQQIDNKENEISRLKIELTENSKNFSESEFVKQAKVLTGVLAYADAAASITQAEFVRAFQSVHDQRKKGPEHFDTKLQETTVQRVFANANAIAKKAGIKKEWFSERSVIDTVTKPSKKKS